MRKLRRFRSSCECAMYHPGLCFPFIHFVVSNDSVCEQWRFWWDCADAKAGLQLRFPHMREDSFFTWRDPYDKQCVWIFFAFLCTNTSIVVLHSMVYIFLNLFILLEQPLKSMILTHLCLASHKRDIWQHLQTVKTQIRCRKTGLHKNLH